MEGSILGPLLFDMFMFDIVFIVNEIDFCSYADDNTPFVTGDRLEDVLDSLENASLKLFDWFSNNQMKKQILVSDIYLRVLLLP